MLASTCYQDGLIDAYQLALDQRSTGRLTDLHRIQHLIQLYEQKITDYRAKKRYWDSAYFRGYQNALIGIALSKERGKVVPPRRYFYEAVGEMTQSVFYKMLNNLPEHHKAAFQCFAGYAAKLDEGMVIHHAPWG
jgi:hypothetical protein